MENNRNIINFCIIAHIDHGKSTLADRMLEQTKTMEDLAHGQMLDKLDLEQERGITIKLTPVRMDWKGCELNLIDTPGHSDFQYEVSRSLVSVEGAILLVDATQGIQAQTLSTLYMAMDKGLEIIPVLNKIDLPAAEPERVSNEIENIIGLPKEDIIQVSGKTGENVDTLMDTIIDRFPGPQEFRDYNSGNFYLKDYTENQEDFGLKENISRALIFDSVYDKYKGVIAYVKVIEGSFKKGDKLYLVNTQVTISSTEVGYFSPDYIEDKSLGEGQIGYILTGQKSVRDVKIGDTMVKTSNKLSLKDNKVYSKEIDKSMSASSLSVPGFKKLKPFVYAGIYPINNDDFEKLRNAFEKLVLNDSAIEYEYEGSNMLGHGFRAGFLGNLHMEIIKERLYREFEVDTIFTTPNVIYLVRAKNFNIEKIKSGTNVSELIKSGYYKEVLKHIYGNIEEEDLDFDTLNEKYSDILKEWVLVRLGGDMPDPGDVSEVLEPIVEVEIVGNNEYTGNIMQLAEESRGHMQGMESIDENRVLLRYKIPLGELITDFNDQLKSVTKGYSTMNYEFKGYTPSELVRIDIHLNKECIEAFSMVVHKDFSYRRGKEIIEKLKELIPRHMFAIPLQASIGTKVIARETIPALKKDVLAKCYGGDVTRKRKLLEKQKEGKKRLKQVGQVSLPNDVFIKVMSK